MNNEARRIDLSTKLRQMGDSLMNESNVSGDENLLITGNLMGFISTLILFDEDIRSFSLLSEMFSAKRVLDSMLHGIPDNISPAVAAHIQESADKLEEKLGVKKKRAPRKKKNDNSKGEEPTP
jgi:hypothetical protein